ncbi:hypothetical protein ZOSMA_4328G00010 [Zostera marina]|uniref:DUF4218 domain-containing protein n=1 Tax=Zostera marina TaxID=29655 RepID=A0A0K9P1T5_ZOSMR|nr:hypothetical protein ZOSMA_4328G00010 [Zostera marina]
MHPEGSIAEKYLTDESMTFCSRFLHNVKTKSNRTERYIDGYYGASTHTSLTKLEHGQVHRYIIFNLDIIEIFRNLHIEDLKQRYPTITSLRLQKLHFKEFADWFETYVQKNRGKNENISRDICSISRGPNFFLKSYNGYILNGVKFLSFEVSNLKKTQNHGILVSAITSTYLKNPNDDPKINDLSYHGTLQKVFEMYWLLVAFVLSVFMVVTTPDQSDHSTDEQDYDHPNLHDMNMAGCDGDQTKKKTREQNKNHAEYHPSQGQRFVIKFRNDQIVHDSVARKLNKKCAMVANDFKLLPMDVPWIEQDQKNIDEAMTTIQVY